MLQSIIQNLISNAIKFTYSEGKVTVSANERNNFVEVSVTDTGIGIAKDDIEKIFSIDVQYTSLGTADEKGTGLGLIICKELVEKNGGKIWIESELDKGSIFVVTFPKA
jgi:signal transduction histidine kinase